MQRGLFITLEGGEGSGKTTFIRHLSEYLTEKKIPHVLTREPGGTPFAEELRQILLLKKETEGIAAKTELLLYLASRSEHVDKVILPNLEKGVFVLCDRFNDSTIAYQGYGRCENIQEVTKLVYQAIPLVPDATFYLDIAPEIGFERLKKRGLGVLDRLEGAGRAFHERVRMGYLELAKTSSRFHVLNGSLPENELASLGLQVLDMIIKGQTHAS